ncbi:conserved hypothetical protein [Beutenbergia cavernae DSM 12333]|uniref:DUF1330 domain-containing protein n=1 Tax=Beutenbergia cavernae (strain ATCC BAA-8 / DSM 12333 / CCUG 43141 / JCM 11478 / NBRC 16432 / NCIMB 13614 / HKI 0122) TaxID=471853 RepID=C5C5Y2_BEUC1|nr:hypothetical protein [Beutenbergia cavernae]ACQ82340.1 conserved hypothetical protein [Beutenbergia cavernae DSM 12333]
MTETLCVLLWAHPGQLDALAAYEDAVLELVPAHGGRVLSRVRRLVADDGGTPAADGQPHEVQVIEIPDDDALAAYLADPRRTALTADRDRAVARTEILRTARVV